MSFSKIVLALFGSLLTTDFGLANEPRAIFYENEDKSGNSLNYFEETDDYQHVQSIVDRRGLKGIALLCATGVFVLYNEEEFDSESDDEVRILAGTDTCLQPGQVKSFVFVQSYNSTLLDTITVFTGERFGGSDVPLKIINDTQYDDARLIQVGQVNSFILMGSSGWTITTRFRTFCFKPEQTSEYSVCPVAHTSSLVLPEELDWLSARLGCEEETDITVIPLTHCFNPGSGNLEPISVGNETGTSNESVDTELEARAFGRGPFDTCGENTDEITMLLRFRVTNEFDNVYQIQFPRNKAHSWRTEILDYTMEILDICIVDGLVDKEILRFVREIYVYLAEKVLWSKGEGWPSKPRQRILQVAHETSRCLTEIAEKEWLNVAVKLSEDILKNMDKTGIKDNDIDQEFRPIQTYDVAMEFIWLSINYVGAACHTALEYETDFWMDYMNVATDMYLRPMAKHWGKPQDFLDYYPVLLGGFSSQLQHRSLAAVTTALYKAVSVEKLARPKEVVWG